MTTAESSIAGTFVPFISKSAFLNAKAKKANITKNRA